MGKGDLLHSNGVPCVSADVPPNGTIRSRHLSSGGGNHVQPIVVTASYDLKHRCPNRICSTVLGLIKPNAGKHAAEKKEHDREFNWKCRSYAVLGILLLANLINYMDRYTIAGVLEEVQEFYSISNAKAGLLQTSFIMSYMLLSPVFGYLGDRYNRKYIMAGGILFWSLITLAGSFIGRENYGVFLVMRALVGVGEASYSTIAPTIIADIFSKSMRTKALSIFYFAIPVGSGLGYIVGSKVAEAFNCWQWALRVTPVLGVLCSILVMVVIVEPPRGASDGGILLQKTSFLSDVTYLVGHKSFMLSSLGFTCVAFVAGALALWAPTYMNKSLLMQHVHPSDANVSLIFGVITCAAGFTGVAAGLYFANLLRRWTQRADPLICAVGLVAGAPFLYLAIILSNRSAVATWVLIFISEALLSLNWALVTDMLLYIVIPTRRSTAEAIQILLSHALGDAGSPYLVGLTTDIVQASYPRQDLVVQYLSLQYSLYICCFVCVIGGGLFFATALFIQADRVRTDNAIKGAAVRTPDSEDIAEELSIVNDISPTDSSNMTPSDTASDDSGRSTGSSSFQQLEQTSLRTVSTQCTLLASNEI
jgi:MFS family permease